MKHVPSRKVKSKAAREESDGGEEDGEAVEASNEEDESEDKSRKTAKTSKATGKSSKAKIRGKKKEEEATPVKFVPESHADRKPPPADEKITATSARNKYNASFDRWAHRVGAEKWMPYTLSTNRSWTSTYPACARGAPAIPVMCLGKWSDAFVDTAGMIAADLMGDMERKDKSIVIGGATLRPYSVLPDKKQQTKSRGSVFDCKFLAPWEEGGDDLTEGQHKTLPLAASIVYAMNHHPLLSRHPVLAYDLGPCPIVDNVKFLFVCTGNVSGSKASFDLDVMDEERNIRWGKEKVMAHDPARIIIPCCSGWVATFRPVLPAAMARASGNVMGECKVSVPLQEGVAVMINMPMGHDNISMEHLPGLCTARDQHSIWVCRTVSIAARATVAYPKKADDPEGKETKRRRNRWATCDERLSEYLHTMARKMHGDPGDEDGEEVKSDKKKRKDAPKTATRRSASPDSAPRSAPRSPAASDDEAAPVKKKTKPAERSKSASRSRSRERTTKRRAGDDPEETKAKKPLLESPPAPVAGAADPVKKKAAVERPLSQPEPSPPPRPKQPAELPAPSKKRPLTAEESKTFLKLAKSAGVAEATAFERKEKAPLVVAAATAAAIVAPPPSPIKVWYACAPSS